MPTKTSNSGLPIGTQSKRQKGRKLTRKSRTKTSLPTAVDIQGYRVTIAEQQPGIRPEAVGEFLPNDYHINIRPGLTGGPVARLDVLLHEIVHALSAVVLPPEFTLSETQVWGLGVGLAQLLLRNPQLRAYIEELAK